MESDWRAQLLKKKRIFFRFEVDALGSACVLAPGVPTIGPIISCP